MIIHSFHNQLVADLAPHDEQDHLIPFHITQNSEISDT